MNDAFVEAAFREKMRALAHRGGAATKCRHDPDYYRRIGALGGRASAVAQKARLARSLAADVSPAVSEEAATRGILRNDSDSEHEATAEPETIAPAAEETMLERLDAIIAAVEGRA